MSTIDVDFYFDFGSPNAWIAHALMPAAVQRSGLRFHYRPMLLGGVFQLIGNRPPMQQFADIPSKLNWFRREMERFVKRHGVPFEFNPHFPVNTLKLMRGAVLFQDSDQFFPYLDTCFHNMWVQPKNLGDEEILGAVLASAGFDTDAFFEGITRPDVKQALIEATDTAVARGVFGAPTFVVGEEVYFGKEQLFDLEADLSRDAPAPA